LIKIAALHIDWRCDPRAFLQRDFGEASERRPRKLLYLDGVLHQEHSMATTVDARRETVSLIGSDKVEGTAVYGAYDQKIGSVQRVMIDKISGKVAYAVVSFGGFLGMGEDYFPIPWPNLKYDINLGGYRTAVTENQLKGAPKFTRSTDWDWSDRSRDRAVYDYYNTPLWY
jgi:PRC-barrel domain